MSDKGCGRDKVILWHILFKLKAMSKLFVLVMIFLWPVNLSANESQDTCRLHVVYHYNFKETTADDVMNMDDGMLEVGSNWSVFYTRNYRNDCEFADSLRRTRVKADDMIEIWMQRGLPQSRFKCAVYKNYPIEGALTCTDEVMQKYCYEEEMPTITWELVEGDSVVAGYACKKAYGELRGRRWSVWYTLEIPYDDGPWKLCGLPGLIMAANEDKGNFSFICIGVQSVSSPMTFWDRPYIHCTPKELQDEKFDFWYDQSGYADRQFGFASNKGADEVTHFTPCLIEYY